MALQATQVDCKGCGAKIDIHAGLRSRTFVCEYCGSVNEGEKVTAVQVAHSMRERFKPWSHLRLGMKAKLLGREYQIIGRVRSLEQYWWWDSWMLYSDSGFPLWLSEGEGGFTIYRVFYPTLPVNPWTAGTFIKLDNLGGNAQVKERGTAETGYLEGELTWSAKPGEKAHYLDAWRGKTRYTIEYSEKEIQYLRGESRDAKEIYKLFGITEPVPKPLVFEEPDDWDEDSDHHFVPTRPATPKEPLALSTKVMLGVVFLLGLGLLAMTVVGYSQAKHVVSYTFHARAGTGADDGVLLTDDKGAPVPITLSKSRGAYELRLASSPLSSSGGSSGGYCWWAQVDFMKERSKEELQKVEAKLKAEGESLDEWQRFEVVHRVSGWFGRYWGIDEGESWNQNRFVHQHYFKTKDPGPYYVRVFADNCTDFQSRRLNPVQKATLTVALYRNVWMTRWTTIGGLTLVGIVLLVVFWRIFT